MIKLLLPEAVPSQCHWGQRANERLTYPGPSQRAGTRRHLAAPVLSARGRGTDSLQKPPRGRTPARSIAQLKAAPPRATKSSEQPPAQQPPGEHRSRTPPRAQRAQAPHTAGMCFLALLLPLAQRQGTRKGEAGAPLTFTGAGGSQVVDPG